MPTETDPATLAAAERAFVVAPAGCGKTELIARAIELGEGRSLVLTHTHSGVNALRARLQKYGVSKEKFHVATIAGLGLRYASAYPSLSGLRVASPSGADWPLVYEATIELLRHRVMRDVLERSYSGVYVDEYQDCSLPQHEIVITISEILPCRLLGDPMQGIFDFSEPTVDWRRDVVPFFERLPDLATPHRWLTVNPELGRWLAEARTQLISGSPINLRDSPAQWLPKTPASQIAACQTAADTTDGSIVAIGKWPRECHDLASRLGGMFGSMEELDCRALMDFVGDFDSTSDGHRWATKMIDFASSCFTVVGSRLSNYRSRYAAGSTPDASRLTTNRAVVGALNRVVSAPSVGTLVDAARVLEGTPGAQLYRRELWQEMKTTLLTHRGSERESITETAWHVRDRSRHNGRPPENRIVSRTLLVKGLEFDHVAERG